MKSDLVIGMAGSGGDGIVSAGESLMTAAALEGYHAHPDEELRPADPRRRVVVPRAALDAAGAATRAARSTSRSRSTGTTS